MTMPLVDPLMLNRPYERQDFLGGAEDREQARLERLQQACSDFEAVFANTLVKALRDSVPESGLLGDSAGSSVYDSMVEQQLSTYLSQGRGLGLGQTIYNQLLRRENLGEAAEMRPNPEGLGYIQIIPPDLVNQTAGPASSVI